MTVLVVWMMCAGCDMAVRPEAYTLIDDQHARYFWFQHRLLSTSVCRPWQHSMPPSPDAGTKLFRRSLGTFVQASNRRPDSGMSAVRLSG